MVADDHAIIRTALSALLSSEPDVLVVGEASDGNEAVARWQETRPDVGLFDMCMPDLDGVEALRRLRALDPQARVIMLTTWGREVDIERALDAGARGYVLKDAGLPEIVACIRSVRKGEPHELDRMKGRLSKRSTAERLTPRETRVLADIARGASNRLVAAALGIGEGTVKTHLKRIYGKLYARNRTEAIAVARAKGLL